MTALGGFETVRFRAGNLESGRSVYGMGRPQTDWRLWAIEMSKWTFAFA